MTTPARVDSDLGWALGTVMRGYLRGSHEAVADVPGGPRGYQVLSAAAQGHTGSQVALAQRLGLDRTVMTYLIDDLERAGLVERRPDPADRRARRVVLTVSGQERLSHLERRLHEIEEHLLSPLDPAEREMLRTLLQRVATDGDYSQAGDMCSVAEELVGEDATGRA